MSSAQHEFLVRQSRHRLVVRSGRILLFLLFLILWEITAKLHLIDSFIFSSPSLILSCLWSMAVDGSLFYHTGVTLWETLLSFFRPLSVLAC